MVASLTLNDLSVCGGPAGCGMLNKDLSHCNIIGASRLIASVLTPGFYTTWNVARTLISTARR
jgi:hypothetical protein